MNAREFVAAFRAERDALLIQYADGAATSVAKRIQSLNLPQEKRDQITSILDDVLSDAFYTILMGLDGAGSLGGVQQGYTISDEAGNVITHWNDGEIEEHAFEAFQMRQ